MAHPEGISITDQFHEIEGELKGYGDSVFLKPRLLVLNKMDAIGDEDRAPLLEEAAKLGLTYYAVSSVTGEGVKELLRDLYDRVRAVHAEEYKEEYAVEIEEERLDAANATESED